MDRLTEMEAFATVVDQGGFTDAARKMGLSKSAVSKHVSALEARLGARLLNRTTRRVAPTEIGLAYYDRARRVLNDAGEADALVSAMNTDPRGRLRIASVPDFGSAVLTPVIGEFLTRFGGITVSMELTNEFIDPVADGYDIVIRSSRYENPALRARRLMETTHRMIASPDYLSAFGRPERIEDLNAHRLLHFSGDDSANVWRLTSPTGERREVRTAVWLAVNDGHSLLTAALAGLGIAYLPEFLCSEALAAGQLVDVLPALPKEGQPIYALYPAAEIISPKVHTFVEFLVERLEAS